ncbi:conserved oligomeric Golgi complex subunit 1 isoform X2 [Homalodisca vitripennis]|uniref:conserved oligomeric Golgi complex subunit 1 isoform X2 n=1 Tax=Homalodisca vitripennis TaxID=197043 RepID=UPI001EE9C1CE|nr:conserved oligomeric Golgi complex subunit 1 isoform X2 [Homalodisca vitripennis]
MPVPGLLTIDPDKLFVQYSILEIEDVQRKLQNEIERKREELRTMVGERYRDLIEAADTISQMKVLSEKVIDDVNSMKISTAELQERQVSGFKIEHYTREVKDNTWACVAFQIKVLVDISEYIWESIDQADFTRATLLFLMARYIKTSLEINPSFKTSEYFPVVSRQWSSVVHFKETILKGAEDTLKSQNLSQVTSSSLVSLALLESLTAEQLLQRYISLRSDALRAVLSSHQTLDSDAIKQRLCHSYTLLIHSITAISDCFVGGAETKNGLLWEDLARHVGPQSPPTLHLLEKENEDMPTSFLPSAIKQFRPVLDWSLEPLPESQVHKAITTWLVWVRSFVKEQGGHLLQRLSSLRSLQGLRDPPAVTCEEWPLVVQRVLLLPNLDLWSELYRSLITSRAQQLVSVHWDAALKQLQHQIRAAIHSAALESKQTEVDLMWYMWKEASNDLNNLDNLKNTKGLWLKSKGMTPRVAELCVGLEHKVCSLLADLTSLCPEQEVDPALLAISHTLKTHQQTVCSTLIVRLVQFVKDELKGVSSESAAMLLAKFLQAVPELCPSLSKCLSSVDTKAVSWQESLSLVQSECMAVYQVWLTLAAENVLAQVTQTLGSVVPDLHSIPQWEEINIEEEGETGEKLQSVLKVPCSASLNLQNSLHNLASVIGHVAVPKQISEQLVGNVLICILGKYNENLQQSLTQTQYLQMLLDVKYIACLFNSISNKDFKEKCQDVILKVESKIDPFDLNVFMPYINDNVKRTAFQTQALLGVSGTSTGQAVSSHSSEQPSVLALSSSATTWFPLLHITAPRTSLTPAKPKLEGSF